jgi:hypothetical protein
MRTPLGRVVLGFALVIGSGSAAQAVNFCFNPGVDDGPHNSLAVALKYRKPHPGSCSPIAGFDIGAADYRSAFGTACLNSAGDLLHVSYVTTGRSRVPSVVSMDLPYPSLIGGAASVYSDDASGSWNYVVGGNGHANACIPQAIPIP